MPDNPVDVGEVVCWLRDSRSDLGLAMAPKTRAIRYAHLCFHAQQAAEKALKAVLIAHAATVPRTHDLAYLLDLLPKSVGCWTFSSLAVARRLCFAKASQGRLSSGVRHLSSVVNHLFNNFLFCYS